MDSRWFEMFELDPISTVFMSTRSSGSAFELSMLSGLVGDTECRSLTGGPTVAWTVRYRRTPSRRSTCLLGSLAGGGVDRHGVYSGNKVWSRRQVCGGWFEKTSRLDSIAFADKSWTHRGADYRSIV